MDNRTKSGEILQNVGYALLSEGKTIRIKAHGYSMYPSIKPGSVILIEPIAIKGNPVVGEIIAVKKNNGLIIHRLSRINVKNAATTYIARGDSNAFEDRPVELDAIAGRIIGAEVGAGDDLPSDTSVNTSPKYYLNRMKVIGVILLKRIKRVLKSLRS